MAGAEAEAGTSAFCLVTEITRIELAAHNHLIT
jgi:hypothetical protein